MINIRKRNYIASILLLMVTFTGTTGYYILGSLAGVQPPWNISECFYMTVITLTTVGFGEVINVGEVPGARMFTLFILVSGLGVAGYLFSTLTAFLVEGELTNVFWRNKMEKQLDKLSRHIIVCGIGMVGYYIMQELQRTNTKFVVIDSDERRIKELQKKFGEFAGVVGDATHADILRKAGVEKAKGVITSLSDDKDNLCVVVTCRQLNPQLHLISSCQDEEFSSKLDLLGAEVVIPHSIGGLRIASQMIRPRVVRYLDLMLRDADCVVRIEDIRLRERSDLIGKPLNAIDFDQFGPLLVLAVIRQNETRPIYNPKRSHILEAGDTLVVQADIESLQRFRKLHAGIQPS